MRQSGVATTTTHLRETALPIRTDSERGTQMPTESFTYAELTRICFAIAGEMNSLRSRIETDEKFLATLKRQSDIDLINKAMARAQKDLEGCTELFVKANRLRAAAL